jgi:hypothetical protein
MAEAAVREKTEPADVGSAAAAPANAYRLVLATVGAYVLFRGTLAFLRLPLGTPDAVLLIASVFVAFGSIGLPIAVIAALAHARPSAGQSAFTACAGLALWFGVIGLLVAGQRWLLPVAGTLQDVGKVLAAGGIGILLGGLIREPNILAPAGVFAAFADFVVVTYGTVHRALQTDKGRAMVAAVSAAVPAIHPKLEPLTIGPADFLFLGLFLTCAVRFQMGLRRNAILLAVVLAGSLLAVQANLFGAVPALAPMSITFVAANWRSFRLSKQEVISTVVVILVAGTLFLGYFLFLFPKK